MHALEDLLEEAIGEAGGLELAPAKEYCRAAEERVLAILVADRGPGLAQSATRPLTGSIILGPSEMDRCPRTASNLMQRLFARRWVLHPAVLGDSGTLSRPKGTIIREPAIVPSARVDLKCTVCNKVTRTTRAAALEAARKIEVNRVRARGFGIGERHYGWSVDLQIPCPSCTAFPVEQIPVYSTAVKDTAGSDPVFTVEEFKEYIPPLLDVWGRPPESVELIPPRLWSAYTADLVPSIGWTPPDASCDALFATAKAYIRREVNEAGNMVELGPCPLTLLPFGMTKHLHQPPTPIHVGGMHDVLIEVPHISIGWIEKSRLHAESKLGWRRHVWPADRERRATGPGVRL